MTNTTDGYPYLAGLFSSAGGTPLSLHGRVLARLCQIPSGLAGVLTGLALLALAMVSLPRDMRRQLLMLLRAACEPFRSADIPVRRRLRLPSLGWRAVTVGMTLLLIANDPAFDSLWTARAECYIPENNSTENERITELVYDFEGRLAQVNSPEGVINYGYNPATGQLTNTCTLNSGIAYQYDELGRLKTVSLLKRNGTNLLDPEITRYTYTKTGSRDTVTLPNGVVTRYLYDSLDRLTNLTHTANGVLLASYTYQLHATGRRTNAVEILRTEDEATRYQTNTFT